MQALNELANGRRGFAGAISYAQSAAQIQVADRESRVAQAAGQGHHFVDRFQNRAGVQDLRSDVAAHAFRHQAAQRPRPLVYSARIGDGNPELVLRQAGGDIRMGRGVYVRVHAHGEPRLDTVARGNGVDEGQFRLRLAVEAVDSPLDGVLDLFGGLPHTKKTPLGRAPPRLEHTIQFTARDNIETRPRLRQQ